MEKTPITKQNVSYIGRHTCVLCRVQVFPLGEHRNWLLSDMSEGWKYSYTKTFRTVAQMCHSEAVELFAVLDDVPSFPTHGVSFWWAYNRCGHHKSHITISNVAQCPLPADGTHFMWLKKNLTTISEFLLCFLMFEPQAKRIAQNISQCFFYYPAEWDVGVMTGSDQ